MSGLLDRLWSYITAPARAVEDLADHTWSAFKDLWSSISDPLTLVKDAWDWMVNGATDVADFVERIPSDVYQWGKWLIDTALPDVEHWVLVSLEHIASAAEDALNGAVAFLRGLYDDVRSGWDDLVTWFNHHIWDAAVADIVGAWHWIDHEGNTIWSYIQHPDALAKLLLDPIWRGLLALASDSTEAIAHWLAPHLVSALVDVADWIESILVALV